MAYADAMMIWRELENAPPLRMLFAQFVGYKNPNKRWGDGQGGAAPISGEDFVGMQKIMGPLQPMPKELKEAMQWAEGLKKKHPTLQ